MFEGTKLSNSNTRIGFIRKVTLQLTLNKVYSILSFQLISTAITVYMFNANHSVRSFFLKNVWIVLVASVVSIITMYALIYPQIARNVPVNYILLGVFTFCESIVV